MKGKKLIANICLIALAICSLAFGVYAAVNANFIASANITFNALNCKVDIEVALKGVKSDTALTYESYSINAFGITTKTKKFTTNSGNTAFGGGSALTVTNILDLGTVVFDDLNTELAQENIDGRADWGYWLNHIEVVITIENYSTFGIKATLSDDGATSISNTVLSKTITDSTTAKIAKKYDSDASSDTVAIILTANKKIGSTGSATENNLFNILVEPDDSLVANHLISNTDVSSQSAIAVGSEYTVTYAPKTGYDLPSAITVKVEGTTLTSGTDYTWNSTSGVLKIFAQKVTGDISVTGTSTPKEFTITYKDQGNAAFSGTHGSGKPTTHTYGTATTLVSPTKTGYAFGGWYTSSTCSGSSISSLTATEYTSNITLYAKWTANSYSISTTLSHVTKTSGDTTITYGSSKTLVFSADTGYELPDDVTVSGATKSWIKPTGTLVISNPTGNVSITISGVRAEPQSQGETWVLNEELILNNDTLSACLLEGSWDGDPDSEIDFYCSFTTEDGLSWGGLMIMNLDIRSENFELLVYIPRFSPVPTEAYGCEYDGRSFAWEWYNEAFRTITFAKSPTGALLTWLQANGTKQTGG